MQEYIKICEEAARAGGAVVQDWIGRFAVQEKGPADLVTQADLASQETIREILIEAFPDHSLLGEEGPVEVFSAGQPEFRWIADPLDGTTNYVHRVPHYCVSLALEHRGELLAATVFDPCADECFTAAAGQGAFLNEQPIRSSDVVDISGALAAVGFPPDVQRTSPDVLVFLEAIGNCQAVRRTGSAALNLCYVAAGRFDVYWSYSTKAWDMAAGALIIQEAGGQITAIDGGPLKVEAGTFLAAANEPLHRELKNLTQRAGL